MYFSFLQALQSGNFTNISPAIANEVAKHARDLFDIYPQQYAKFINAYPKQFEKLEFQIYHGYAHHLVAHKKRFSEQTIFPAFYHALSDSHKRTITPGLIWQAVEYNDPPF